MVISCCKVLTVLGGCLLFYSSLGEPENVAVHGRRPVVPSVTNALGMYTLEGINFSTIAYEAEAKRLIVKEANEVAEQLKLSEKLPIVEADLTEVFICKYGMSQVDLKAIGNIRTRNYAYYASVDHKLSYLERMQQEKECFEWVDRYRWPKDQIDTNGAYRLATQWLAAARMDVERLNYDCSMKVEPDRFWNEKLDSTNAFVPIYYVSWRSPENKRVGYGSVASVSLFLPTQTLIGLRVHEPKYILRQSLVFTNLDALLSQPTAK